MSIQIKPKQNKHLWPTRFLQQTAFWSRLKKTQGCQALAFDICADHSRLQGDFLVLLRRLQHEHCMAYVPFGPELLPNQDRRGAWLEEISEKLRPLLPDNCLFLRYDLPWKSPWMQETQNPFAQEIPQEEPRTEVREMRMNIDTTYWNLRKAFTDLLPTDTVILDLRQDPQTILQGMKPKTRYNIRLAERKGVRVRQAGLEELPLWYKLYQETALRHGMLIDDLDYFRAALQIKARESASPARVYLLLAETEERILAGMLLAISGSRATYLYGASASNYRQYMAPYILQWSAINLARQLGCQDYDFFGIAPYPDPEHPMYGLYRFKTGFGGRIVHRQGCWDYPFDQGRYELCRSSEMTGQAFVS